MFIPLKARGYVPWCFYLLCTPAQALFKKVQDMTPLINITDTLRTAVFHRLYSYYIKEKCYFPDLGSYFFICLFVIIYFLFVNYLDKGLLLCGACLHKSTVLNVRVLT